MTREEYLAWCKKRALEYLDQGDVKNAIASMISDMQKHDETKYSAQGVLGSLGLSVAMSNDVEYARRFITGFR